MRRNAITSVAEPGAPVEARALLIAVEVLPDIVRTLGNVMHDVAVTTTVSRQSGETVLIDAEPAEQR